MSKRSSREAHASKDGATATSVARETLALASSSASRPSDLLSRAQKIELYYWMRMTRTLEERLVALYRQTKVVGDSFGR